VDRFLRAVQPAVWGYTLSNVFVMSRDAFLNTGKLLSHAAATEAQLLIKLSDVQLDATVLYVSHKWSSLIDPDASGGTYTQVSHSSTSCTCVAALCSKCHSAVQGHVLVLACSAACATCVLQSTSHCCCIASRKRCYCRATTESAKYIAGLSSTNKRTLTYASALLIPYVCLHVFTKTDNAFVYVINCRCALS
jgi:hypothetical protein